MQNDTDIKKVDNPSSTKAADFETAIAATGYGKFNYLLLLIAAPCCFTSVFETTTMSIILPSAECDLNLSLVDKGILNAITYGGMITSAFLWGFLSDVLGRKKLLVYGYLSDAFFIILCAFSNSFLAIMIYKFISGFILCGPFAILMSYLSELHGLKYRTRIMLSTGIFFSMANILLPSIAWVVIPNPWWNITIVEPYLKLHTWQSFLLISSLPSIISGLSFMMLPESPKFLMSRGANDAAMKVFLLIHRLNNGEHVKYSITSLVNERAAEIKSVKMSANTNETSPSKLLNGIRSGFSQMSVMLEPPHFKNACLVYIIQFCILTGLNTFRLWVVQLFAIMKEFEMELPSGGMSSDANLCKMIQFKVNKTEHIIINAESTYDCEPNLNDEMFLNSMLISVIQLGLYMMVSLIINFVGNRNMLIFGLLISGSCGISLYWAKDLTTMLLLSAGYISFASISSTTLVGSVVSLFPTATRTMNVSLAMMFGRSGAIIGNLLFPILMTRGCLPPFVLIGGIVLICSFICFFIPKTTKKPLD